MSRLIRRCSLLVCLGVLGCSGAAGKADAGSTGPDAGPEIGFIPGGTFQMGSATGFADEQPVTSVTLTPYALDRTEVTVAAYAACVTSGQCTLPGLTDNGWCNWGVAGKENDPINCVSWDQSKAYCEAQGKRLPTEAEWEFGARGPMGFEFPWGNDHPPSPSEDSTLVRWGPGLGFTTAPVGTHPDGASPFGLQDMAGNVWEWVEDEYRTYPGGSVVNPLQEDTHPGFNHVARGGSWIEGESQLRTTARFQAPASHQNTIVGFRCARHMSWGPQDPALPVAPAFFVVKARSTNSVTLSWDPAEGLDGIVLYSAADPNSTSPTEQQLAPTASSVQVMQEYTGVATYYWLRFRAKGELGPPSRTLRASPLAPAPTGVTLTSSLASIQIVWQPVSVPVLGYEIFRNGQDWTPTGPSMTRFGDGNLERGRTYTYVITALGPDLNPGLPAPAVTGQLGPATSVVAGHGHWCALGEDKTAWCWGRNTNGALGDGTTDVVARGHHVLGPAGEGHLSDVKAIAPGGGFTCALKTDGTVWCWGLNDKGQLGNESTTNSSTPVQVHSVGGLPFGGVELIDAGATHTCVVKTAGGGVFCWGDNSNSALGASGFTSPYRTTPIAVVGPNNVGTLSGAVSISVGSQSACITKANNSVWCWGYDSYGQLGDNQADTNGTAGQLNRAYAVQVVGPNGVGTLAASEVSVGLYQACAVGTDGVTYCWGNKAPGDYAVNSTEPINQGHYWGIHHPIANPGLDGTGTLTGVSGLGGLWHHYCGVTADHHSVCWEENPFNVLLNDSGAPHAWPVLSSINGIDSIAPGTEASCGLFSGVVQCWGTNTGYQLGDDTNASRTTPAPVLFSE